MDSITQKAAVLLLALLAGSVRCQNKVKVTRKNFMDNAGYGPINAFEFGDFTVDFSIAVTRVGQAYIKKLTELTIPDPLTTFRLNGLQTFW